MINNTLSNEWNVDTLSTIMVVCLALQALIKDQVEQLNKIGVARMAIAKHLKDAKIDMAVQYN